MAYRPITGDVLSTTTACAQGSQVSYNTIYFQVLSYVGAGVLDTEIAAAIDNTLAILYKPLLGSNASFYGVRVARVAPGPSTIPAVSALNVGVGTAATTCMAAQVSGILKATTAFAGVRMRGRNYIPFPYLGATDPVTNVPTVAYKALLTALGAQAYTPYTITSGLNQTIIIPVIYHRASNTTDSITAYSASLKWGTQVRRGNYGRPNTYPPF